MDSKGIQRAVCITSLLASTIATAGQERDLKKRLTPAEVDAVQTEVAGAGTSGLSAVTTRVLFGGSHQAWSLHDRATDRAEHNDPGAYAPRHSGSGCARWFVVLRLRAEERAVAREGFRAR